MKKAILVIMSALAIFALSSRLALAHDVELTMVERNGSGQNGTVKLIDQGDGTAKVVVELSNGNSTPQPVHIHNGTCDALGDHAYELNDIVNGKSETIVNADVDELVVGKYAINAHKSAAEIKVYVACANLVEESGSSGEGEGDHEGDDHTPGMPRTGGSDMNIALAALTVLALSMVGVGRRLSRREM